MNNIIGFLVLIFLIVWGSAVAQENQEQRLQTLENEVAALKAAQEGTPAHDFHMTGYANVQYSAPEEGKSTFTTLFAPIFLYKVSERLLFEGELEFQLVEGETDVAFEYSQIDYMFADNAVLVTGKMLLPLGTFGERGHPSWINKLPMSPLIYGGHHGSPVGLIPVMSDFGVQLRGGFPSNGMRWNYAAYIVNGPRISDAGTSDTSAESSEGGHADLLSPNFSAAGEADGGNGHSGASRTVDYSPSADDDNNDKAFGFRFGAIPIAGIEIGLSYYTAKVAFHKFVDHDELPGDKTEATITLTMVDFVYQAGPLRVQGEYLLEDASAIGHIAAEGDGTELSEELEVPENRSGYWVEISHMFGGWVPELVLRYGITNSDGDELGSQTALGFNWWLESSFVLKLAAASNSVEEGDETETTTDYFVALAMGF